MCVCDFFLPQPSIEQHKLNTLIFTQKQNIESLRLTNFLPSVPSFPDISEDANMSSTVILCIIAKGLTLQHP